MQIIVTKIKKLTNIGINCSKFAGTATLLVIFCIKISIFQETRHSFYYANNPTAPYCIIVIKPKLEKISKLKLDHTGN